MLRLFTILRVVNPKTELNLVPNPLYYQNVSGKRKKNGKLKKEIENFDTAVQKLLELEVEFCFFPTQTKYGFMPIVVDVDGRKIELYKNR